MYAYFNDKYIHESNELILVMLVSLSVSLDSNIFSLTVASFLFLHH